ncbi:hypothetical protein KDL44_15320 [bacterium]|nr:hypothetical protein [bacterium]
MGRHKPWGIGLAACVLGVSIWMVWRVQNSPIVWQKRFHFALHAVATEADNVYILQSNNSSGNGNILECLDLQGKQLWKQDLALLNANGTADYDLALAWRDRVYLAGGNQSDILAVDGSGLLHVVSVPSGIWHLIPSGDELYAVTTYGPTPQAFHGALVLDDQLQLLRRIEFDGHFMALDVGDNGNIAYIDLDIGRSGDLSDDHQDLVCLDRNGLELFRRRGDYNSFGNIDRVESTYVACLSKQGFEIYDLSGNLLANEGGQLIDLKCGSTESGKYFGETVDPAFMIHAWDSLGGKQWSIVCQEDYFSFCFPAGDRVFIVEDDIIGHTWQSYMSLPQAVRTADVFSKPGDPANIRQKAYLSCLDDNGRRLWRTPMPDCFIGRRSVVWNPQGLAIIPAALMDGSKTPVVFAVRTD